MELMVGRWTMQERIQRTLDLATKYHAEAISLEAQTTNEGMRNGLQEEISKRRMRVRLVPITGRSMETKELRIEGLQPRFESRRIFFVQRDQRTGMGIPEALMHVNRNGKVVGDCMGEFLRFPKAAHDDVPDALSDVDKRDKRTEAYLFPGPAQRQWTPQESLRPGVLNNRYAGTPEARKDANDFWTRARIQTEVQRGR
jgi:phage terminase large subunit-like protein